MKTLFLLRRFRICVIVALNAWNLTATASRTINLPPLDLRTVHGGLIGGMTCITADMLNAASYPGPGGVSLASQTYTLSFKNLSSTPQDVTITALPGTRVESFHSRGGASGVPDTSNGGKTFTAAKSLTFRLAGNGDRVQDLSFTTSSTNSAILPFDSSLDCSTATPQICLMQISHLILQIKIDQDRGAVSANLTTSAHRCNGWSDHYLEPPFSFAINGGRPF